MKVVFFCEKFSDLEHSMPLICTAIEEGRIEGVLLIWYGDLLTNQTTWLLNAVFERSRTKCIIQVPGLFRMHRYYPGYTGWSTNSIFRKYLIRVIQRVASLRGDVIYHPYLTHQIKRVTDLERSFNTVGLFCFYDRPVIRRIALRNTNWKWIRIPHGLIVTQSVHRSDDAVTRPNMGPIQRYVPDYADLGLTTDLMVNDYYKGVGYGSDLRPATPIGCLRYSCRWIREFHAICGKYKLDKNEVSEKPTALFLLTPFHKNVWREEVQNSIKIIATYSVNLVIKGFHANTDVLVPDFDNVIIDEATPTPVLTRQADYIFYIATSAVIEPILDRKKVIQLSYLHCNELHFESLGLGLRVNSRDGLHRAMKNIVDHGYVHGEVEDTKVCEKIRNFLWLELRLKDAKETFLKELFRVSNK